MDAATPLMQGMAVNDRTAAQIDVPTLYALLRLRVDVFVVEQACPYPELDGRDLEPSTRHVWLAPPGDPAAVVAYLRILVDSDEVRRVGRVVTAPSHRGRGLSRALLRHVVQHQRGVVVLDAQAHLQAFYEGLGFGVAGAGFVEDGIPHVPMRREG